MNMKIIAGIIIMAVILTGTAIGVQTGFPQEDNSEFLASFNGESYKEGWSELEGGITVELVDKGIPPEDILPYENPFEDLPVIENPGDLQYLDPDEPYPRPPVYFPPVEDIIWITPSD